MFRTGYVLGITRGHNAAVCLLYNGEIVFHLEEERLTRQKYDGEPISGYIKVLEFTKKIDYAVIAHTQPLVETEGAFTYTGENVVTGTLRKLGLIEKVPYIEQATGIWGHPQVIDLSEIHHKLHAACAFYRSGFDSATALIVDGAGTFTPMESSMFSVNGLYKEETETYMTYEVESIIECSYPAMFKNVFKHNAVRDPCRTASMGMKLPGNPYVSEPDSIEEFGLLISDRAGIVKAYEGATEYCGFTAIEAGKTMGLSPYGEEKDWLSKPWFHQHRSFAGDCLLSDRNIIAPCYPNSAFIQDLIDVQNSNDHRNSLTTGNSLGRNKDIDLSEQVPKDSNPYDFKSRQHLAWKVQHETEKAMVWYIKKAFQLTGNHNIVISGGYALNCVANYKYLEELKDLDLNIYVEPISSDAGTCIGAAMMFYKFQSECDKKVPQSTLYLGPKQNINMDEVKQQYEFDPMVEFQEDVKYEDVVKLLTEKNIVAMFQGRSESGPRALGNRSLLFDPRFKDGKDFVNKVKKREWFRPFAGSILLEDAPDWFDMRGLKESPDMMYAMDCKPGIAEKIPSIIHVDDTCRIQTVKEEDNYHYYNLIKTFKEKEGCPIVFNTSFNLGGDPLVETLEDAIDTLLKSQIEYLYLPEHSIIIKCESPNMGMQLPDDVPADVQSQLGPTNSLIDASKLYP